MKRKEKAKKTGEASRFTVLINRVRYVAYKRGSRWWVRWQEGKLMRLALKVTNEAEAEQIIYDMFQPATPAPPNTTRVLVKNAVSKFMDHCEVVDELKPKTLAKYRAAFAAFMRFCTQEKITHLDSLTLPHLESFQVYRRVTENCVSSTVHHDYGTVKRLFKFACQPTRKLLARNVAAEWKMKKPKTQQRHCFTEEKVRMLQDGCRDWLKPIVTALAYTGMRIGELENLRWQDVDLDGGMINITARKEWQPKNGESRSVPIHPEVQAVLLKLKLGHKGKYVFKTPKGKQLNQNHVREAFEADKKKLGIVEGTPHSFRHFFVSLCANNNVPERVCMTWVGHKDSDMVRYYYHLHDPVSKRAMKNLVQQSTCHSDLTQNCTFRPNSASGAKKETA